MTKIRLRTKAMKNHNNVHRYFKTAQQIADIFIGFYSCCGDMLPPFATLFKDSSWIEIVPHPTKADFFHNIQLVGTFLATTSPIKLNSFIHWKTLTKYTELVPVKVICKFCKSIFSSADGSVHDAYCQECIKHLFQSKFDLKSRKQYFKEQQQQSGFTISSLALHEEEQQQQQQENSRKRSSPLTALDPISKPITKKRHLNFDSTADN
eukprot:gene13344-14721_t